MAEDLFSISGKKSGKNTSYTAKDIEVLEGLEPVRRRPGMYIGGTDENAMHHLVAETFDNAMDEAVAGHATRIEVRLSADNFVTISDNGRGIPVDPHPKFPKKSALEVIMTMLHSGGKFSNKSYETSGGLHGVGISVVNALSDKFKVEVVRDKTLYSQEYSRGSPLGRLRKEGAAPSGKRGTTVSFQPDPQIFGDKTRFKPAKLYNFAKSKAYLYKGVEIRWNCDPALLSGKDGVPENDVIHFPNGLVDFMAASLEGATTVTAEPFYEETQLAENQGRVEVVVHWPLDRECWVHSYCNTIPTPLGGTHETGIRTALYRGVKHFGELSGNKKAEQIISDDVFDNACVIISLFIKDPQFQGQTKEKLVSSQATRLVENAVRDHFDHWLTGNPEVANVLMDYLINRAEERIRRKNLKDINRKSVTQKLRLPGKLADCTREQPQDTEIFLVEGDSAGGSAKQARDRETQAVLPLRGKILNVASATSEKIYNNQEIKDMLMALGCGSGEAYNERDLRYEKIVIMTDADVDGAHIASLLMTYFYQEMRPLIENGHLYLAQPPLYRITQGDKTYYARDDVDKEKLVAELMKTSRKQLEIGRFKGLGEMTAPQLKETTMDKAKRILLKVVIADNEREATDERVKHLMGRNPELRFKFIQEQSATLGEKLREKVDL